MKTKLSIIALSGLFLLAGCSKEEIDVLEINPNSNTQILEKSIDGIIFKFYLTDEEGTPCVLFKKGDDIVFNFTIKNETGVNQLYQQSFLNDNLFRVYRASDNRDMGKSWTGWKETFEIRYAYYMSSGLEVVYDCSWQNNDTSHFLSMDKTNPPLPHGDYYTTAYVKFPYMEANESDYTGIGWNGSKAKQINGPLFRIYFKVQ